MTRQAIKLVAGLLLAMLLAGCDGGAGANRTEVGQGLPKATVQRPEATVQRPEVTVPVAQGQGVTLTVSENELNKVLSQALSAASNPAITAISVDLRPGVIGVSATVLVEGKEISTQMGLAPVVDACSLSLSVVEQPSQPSGIPAPLWDAVVDEVVAAIEAAIVTPQRACISAVTVSDGQLSATVGRR